jgi:hypothetical protein
MDFRIKETRRINKSIRRGCVHKGEIIFSFLSQTHVFEPVKLALRESIAKIESEIKTWDQGDLVCAFLQILHEKLPQGVSVSSICLVENKNFSEWIKDK